MNFMLKQACSLHLSKILAFADDVILFLGNKKMLDNILDHLVEFLAKPGLRLNLKKCQVY